MTQRLLSRSLFIWLILRLFFALVPLALLGGCGFAPAIDEDTQARLAQVKVLPIAERQGQLLNTALRDELNPRA